MLAGIQIFNLAGSLEIDYATRLGLFIGAVQTDAVHGNSTRESRCRQGISFL